MSRSTPVSHRPAGHNGNSLPPHSGGGDDNDNHNDDRSRRGGGDNMPNYGQRLRRARIALLVFMAPILVLFISFTVVYLVRRAFVGADTVSATYTQTWIPVRLPWTVLLANTVVLRAWI